MKRSALFLLSLCMLLITCSDSDDPIKEIENKDPFITLKKTNINFSNEGGSEAILIESNVTWTAKSSASWCTVSPSSGNKSTESITFSAPANENYDDRSCTVTLEGGGVTKTITVKQGKNLGLLVTQDRYELSNEESTIKVEVKANVEFEVEINDEWITQVKTRGLTTTNLFFEVAKNESYSGREGTITIKQKDGNMSSTITISQPQGYAIILSEKVFELTSEAQSIVVELKTNIDYEIIIPEEAKSWVTHATTRSFRTETMVFNIAENRNYDERTVEIIIKEKNTDLQEALIINQSKRKDIIITKKSYDINTLGGALEVVVRSSIEFEVIIPDNAKWIQLDKIDSKPIVDGLSTMTVYFNISKYDGDDSRTCNIQFSNTFEGISESITITQSGNKDTFWGDITLSSLQEFEDFKNKEYKKIVGNLYIKSISGFSDLGLMGGSLTEVSGEIYINGDFLTNLNGLKSLRKVGYLTINKYKGVDFRGLESLTSIVYDFQLLNECRPLSSFKGLDNLKSIGGSFKMIGDLYDFHELYSFEGLDNLVTIGKDFVIESDFYHFRTFNGLSGLKTIGGNFRLSTADRTSFQSFDKINDFNGLNNLERIGGSLTLWGSFDNLISFEGLESLTFLGGNLIDKPYYSGDYSSFNSLTSFKGLDNLKTLGGIVLDSDVSSFNSLKSFEGLENIERINRIFILGTSESFSSFSSFNGLNKLVEIGSLQISNLPNLTNFQGLENLKSVKSSFQVYNFDRLNNIDALYNLTSVGAEAESSYYNRFEIMNCSRLFDFCSLTNMVHNFTGTLILSDNGYNPTLEQMQNGECKSE